MITSNVNRVLFSSVKMDWTTPTAVYQSLNSEFSFDFDPCPPSPEFNGLTIPWGERNFVNPPYGRELPKWIKKGYLEYVLGKTVVFLIPSRTDTKWWHEYIMKASDIRFIKGRLKFGDSTNSAPFPSAVIVFDNRGCLA
jgi:DNA N-6-adenine-methyltransferase (Dam)